MNLPSRGERESATTTRYTGFFFDPTRVNLMRTAKPLPPCLGSLLAFVGFRRLALRRLRRRRGTRQLWKLAAAHALHELLHLLAAFEQAGDLFHPPAPAARETPSPRALDPPPPRTPLRGPRQGDRLDPRELPLL